MGWPPIVAAGAVLPVREYLTVHMDSGDLSSPIVTWAVVHRSLKTATSWVQVAKDLSQIKVQIIKKASCSYFHRAGCFLVCWLGLLLPAEVVLNADDVGFVGGVFFVCVLPDFGDHSPAGEAYEAVTFAAVEADDFVEGECTAFAFCVCVAGYYACFTGNEFPDLCAAVMILP